MRFFSRNISLFATIAVFLLVVVAASMRYPGFFGKDLFINLLRDNAFLGIASIGMTFVILSGGIDLSVGAVIGFTSIFVASLIDKRHVSPPVAIAISLAVGTLFGSGMGYVIGKYKIPPFLVTLAGMFMARGAGFIISLESIDLASQKLYSDLGSQQMFLPALMLGVALVAGYVLHYRPFGRSIYAIGGNEASALLMGLPVRNVKIGIYAISGFCAALAGVAQGFYTSSGNATAGTGLELDAIAAVVIGGTLLQGGAGNLIGTLFGVVLLGVIQTVITFDGTLSSWWTKIVVGALMFVFLLVQRGIEGGFGRKATNHG